MKSETSFDDGPGGLRSLKKRTNNDDIGEGSKVIVGHDQIEVNFVRKVTDKKENIESGSVA